MAAIRSFARKREAIKLDQISATQLLVLNKLDITGTAGVVKITPAEAMLLTAFARAPAGKLETWQIAEIVELQAEDSLKAGVAMRVARLRKKLADAGAQGLVLESIRNTGYQILVHIDVI